MGASWDPRNALKLSWPETWRSILDFIQHGHFIQTWLHVRRAVGLLTLSFRWEGLRTSEPQTLSAVLPDLACSGM